MAKMNKESNKITDISNEINSLSKKEICLLTQHKDSLTKIDKIRHSAVKVISEKGIVGASVVDIANDAQVSVGYLYRYYPSKKELINDVIFSIYNRVLLNIEQILNNSDDIENITSNIVNYYFRVYKKSPATIKFLIMLINDFSFEATDNQKNYLLDICNRFYKRCIEKRGISEDISIEKAYIALVTIPIQSLSMELRGIVFDKCTLKQIKDRTKKLSITLLTH